VRQRSAVPSVSPPAAPQAFDALLDAPSIASKRWVYEQYDSTVQAGTVVGPGGDAGVLGVRGERFGLAVSVDCNSRYVHLDPFEGGKAAVAEAARNVACVGALPIGITNCLNFGSPERPEVFFQFREAVSGMGEACRVLGTPVTGGNVSFYNESPGGAVWPTPVVGMVGLIDDVALAVRSHAQAAGDRVVVLGETRAELGGSAYWEVLAGFLGGSPPKVDLDAERRLVHLLVALAAGRLVRSAHDCSHGGLAVALAEVAMGPPYGTPGFGLNVDLTPLGPALGADALLFSESHGRVVLTAPPEPVAAVLALAAEHGVPARDVGEVGRAGGELRIRAHTTTIERPIGGARDIYFGAMPRRMGD
ncbi:MAG: AIR synthase related protein, partial [Gemmatimonadales bacterium]